MNKLTFIVSLILVTLLQGCSTSKSRMQNTDAPTMKAMYAKKFHRQQGLQFSDVKRLDVKSDDAKGKLHQSVKPLQVKFRYLHNPTLVMYVTPHLTSAGTPIPGYVTYFKLFENHPVALPHEQGVEVP